MFHIKETIKQLIRYRELKAWYETYERYLMPATLVVGVCFDWLTFTSISITSTFTILISYAGIAGGLIVFMQVTDTTQKEAALRQAQGKAVMYLRLVSPLLIQFLFGALLSGSFIFYWFSGALVVSWPLIVIFVFLMVGNEAFRHYYLRPTVQVSIYFFCLFSLLSILFPYVFNSLSPLMFVLGGLVSLGLMALGLWLLSRKVVSIRERWQRYALPIVGIFSVMHILYFLNVIPPVPLTIRETGVYHLVQRHVDGYRVVAETESWWEKLLPQTISIESGDPVYIYSAIFAPAELKTKIVHRWRYFDERQGRWVDTDQLSFSLTGGRNGGFRGYSKKTTAQPGKWRVYVETERGQVLGRISFRVMGEKNTRGNTVLVK